MKFYKLTFAIVSLALGVFFVVFFLVPHKTTFGATYSNIEARYLGLDEKGTFDAVVSELGVKDIRLPVYWTEVQHGPNDYDWSLTDYYMDEAAKHGVHITLAIGFRVPRWPECHIPDFAAAEVPDAFKSSLMDYLTTAVNRYKDSPALVRYQVENEPLFPFGTCPKLDSKVLADEIALVRSLDPVHPIQLTVSGEQEPWMDLAGPADVLGISLYRFAWNGAVGLVVFPHSPLWYAVHKLMVMPWVQKTIISELQTEPWFEDGKIPATLEEAYDAFPVERLREHINFARQTGFSEVDVWGVEWWYYLHEHGDDRLWNEGKELFL